MLKSRLLLLTSVVLFLVVASGCTNRPPVISCMSASPTVIEGRSVGVSAEISDRDRFGWGGDDKKLTVSWSAEQGRVTGESGPIAQKGSKTLSGTFDATGLRPGRYQVMAEVSDRKLAESCTIDITVEKNKQAPTIACEPSNVQVTEEQSTTVSARASDPNGDSLSYSWTVDGQSVSNNQSSFQFGTTGRSVGVHTVRVTASDVDNMSASCNFNVTINRRPNNDPTASLSLDKNSVLAGESIRASVQASDSDGDSLTYSWTVDGQRRPETSSSLNIDTRGMAGGRHSVSVTVEDDRGGSTTETMSFSVREKIIVQVNALRLDNVAKAQLDEIALKMRQNPQLRASLTGHTDDRGSEEGNQRYGTRRAEAVQDYLVGEQGADAGRIQIASAGETQPMADNGTEQGRRDNRRVEVELFVP